MSKPSALSKTRRQLLRELRLAMVPVKVKRPVRGKTRRWGDGVDEPRPYEEGGA